MEFIRMFKDWGQMIQGHTSHTHKLQDRRHRTNNRRTQMTPVTPLGKTFKTHSTLQAAGQPQMEIRSDCHLADQNNTASPHNNTITYAFSPI
jgi:hypothetical protein